MANKIFIVAGDLSGDIHAARLVEELRRLDPGCRVSALGGENLERVSDEFLANLVSMSAFGFWEPARQYFRLKNIFSEKLLASWDAARPDKVILVDFYGFNIHVAREAFRRKIPVHYYISPQVWATRPHRVRELAKYVRKMLVILPFEEEIYRKAGLDATFVGHPLIDMVPEPSPAPAGKPVIGIFPGSRPSVFVKHLPILKEAAKILSEKAAVDFRLFTLKPLEKQCAGLPFPVVTEGGYEQRKDLTLAITTSGTVSLELALMGIPMIVMYRLSRFNYFLARLLIRVPYITMANILAGELVVPELVQNDAAPEKIAAAALEYLKDPARLASQREKLVELRAMLGEPGAAARAANIIMER